MDFLRIFRFQRRFIQARASGPQVHVMGFEIYVLAIVNELYFRRFDEPAAISTGRARLQVKLAQLRAFDTQTVQRHPFEFFDFGVRRRFSGAWQEEVVRTLNQELPQFFKGQRRLPRLCRRRPDRRHRVGAGCGQSGGSCARGRQLRAAQGAPRRRVTPARPRRSLAQPTGTARQPARAPAGAPVLIDTGVLAALFDRLDTHHGTVAAWMAANLSPLLTVTPVLTEAAFFLPARLRIALAGLAARGVLQVRQPDASGRARIADLFAKYAGQNPDWADIELIWLAETSGVRRIATLDVADFSVYRIHGRKRFELELLR